MLPRLNDRARAFDYQPVVVDVNFERFTIDARQIDCDKVTGFGFVDVRRGCPIRPLKLIARRRIAAPLGRVFESNGRVMCVYWFITYCSRTSSPRIGKSLRTACQSMEQREISCTT